MRTLLAGLVLAAFALASGMAPAGEKADKIHYPINGKDATWVPKKTKNQSHWAVGRAVLDDKDPGRIKLLPGAGPSPDLVNTTGGGVDLSTADKFGDCRIEVEFMVPKSSNSGVYVMGEYEVQVFDSFGKDSKKLTGADVGAIYSAAVPKINAARAPGEWQKFVIDFRAPRFDGEKRTAPAKFVRVELNGQVIHENVEMIGPTPGGLTGKEHATGPLMFQGDHGPVAYRNIRITTK
jgi:hypothetical protein